MRLPAYASLDRFVSLAECRAHVIVATPGVPPRRLPAIVIPGTAEQPSEPDDEVDAEARGTAGSGAMMAALRRPAALTSGPLFLTRVRHRSPRVGTVRIAPTAREFDPERFAAMASVVPATVPATPLVRREAILTLAPRSYRTRFDQLIAGAARRHAIDPLLLHAVIRQESNYGAHAISHAGAVGLMQIMPATGARFGQAHGHLFDPMRNIDTGARLLRVLHQRYHGDLDLVLAAYNAGEGAVARYGDRVPPYRETRNYVRLVKARYAALASENGFSGMRF